MARTLWSGVRGWLGDLQSRVVVATAAFGLVAGIEWLFTLLHAAATDDPQHVSRLAALVGLWAVFALPWVVVSTLAARLTLGPEARQPLLRRPLRWAHRVWRERHEESDHRRLATFVAVAVGLVGFAAASVGFTAGLIEHRHGPMLIALTSFAGQLAIALVMAWVALALRRGCLGLLGRLPLRGVARTVVSFPAVVAACAAVGVAGLVVVVVRYWETVVATDAIALAMPLLAVGLQEVLALVALDRWRWRPWVWALPVVGLVSFGLLAQGPDVRRWLTMDAQTGRFMMAAVRTASDVDGDGAPSFPVWLDCAPLDPNRHPLATEIPDNGVDENCDGLDVVKTPFSEDRNDYEPRPGPPPGLVLVTVDALRADHLGLMGYARDTTPNLDEAAKRAVVFEQAYSQDSGTGPSLWSLHTGKTPFQVRLENVEKFPPRFADDEKLLAEQLKARGYATAAVLCGSVFASPHWNLKRGFDHYEEVCGRTKRDQAPVVTKKAVDRLRALAAKDAPFFVWIHYYDPHGPYSRHEQFGFGDAPMDAYDEEIRYTDEAIGELLGVIEELGEERDIYWALTADHGENFGEHGKAPHARTLYRPVTHVPLIVSGPDVVPARITAPVAINDLFPTFMQLAGAPVPPETTMTGQFAVLFGGEADADRLVFQENSYSRPKRHVKAVLSSRYHFIMDLTTGVDELYDWQQDPGEKKNLAGKGLEAEEELKGVLLQFIQTTIHYDNLSN